MNFKSSPQNLFLNVETSPLVYRANQWTGFYMAGTSNMKKLMMLFFLVSNDSTFSVKFPKVHFFTNNTNFQ